MALTSPEVTELTVLSAPKLLLHEWLTGWFDGEEHAVGEPATVSGLFPLAAIAFDQGPIKQPLDTGAVDAVEPTPEARVEIRVTIMTGPDTVRNDAGAQLVSAPITINFWIRSKHRSAPDSRGEAQQAGDLLRAILTNPASRLDLALKGLQHLQPRTPSLVSATEYAMYLLVCPAKVEYWTT